MSSLLDEVDNYIFTWLALHIEILSKTIMHFMFFYCCAFRQLDRETPTFKIWSYPHMCGWPYSPRPNSNLINTNNPLQSAMYIIPAQVNLLNVFLNQFLPWFHMFSSFVSLSSFDLQPQHLMPFSRHDHTD